MPKNNPTSLFALLPVLTAILFSPTPVNHPHNATVAVSPPLPPEVVLSVPTFASVSAAFSTPLAVVADVKHAQVAQVAPDIIVRPSLETIALPPPGPEIFNTTDSIEVDYIPAQPIEINARHSVLDMDMVLEHLRENRVAYAIGVPLFFLPVLWIIFCIWCFVKRSAPYTAYYLIKETVKSLQDCPPFVAAVFLLQSILPPSRMAAEYMAERKSFWFGIETGVEYLVCVLTAGSWLDEKYLGCSHGKFIVILAGFWGLAGFLKGCGWASDYRPSYSATYQTTGRDQDSYGDSPSTGSVTFQDSIMQDHEILDDENRKKISYTRLAAQNSLGRNSEQGLKNSSPRAQIQAADYDADAETDSDSDGTNSETLEDPVAHSSPKQSTRQTLTAKGFVPASIKGGQRRGAARPLDTSPVQDKKNRPMIHPSVRDIIGAALYDKLENRQFGRAPSTSACLPSDAVFTSGPVPAQPSGTPSTADSDYLLPPARTPKHSRYTSTPRGAEVETSPLGPTLSALDIPNMPEAESLLMIDDDLLHPSISPAGSLLSIPLSAANSVADELNATFDLSREWEPYGGENQFVFGVQAKAVASKVVEASAMKGGHRVQLTLGGGTFENEDGVETCTRLPSGRPRSALLDKIDARLAQIGVRTGTSTVTERRHAAIPSLRGIQRMKDFRWPNKGSSLGDVAEE